MPSPFTFTGYGGKFAVLRSYIKGVCASWVSGSSSSLTGDIWRVEGIYTGIDTYQDILFYHPFLLASSNRYTPDRAILDYYYVNLPSPVHIPPLPINVGIKRKPGTSHLYLNLDSLGFPDFYYLDLPLLGSYWDTPP